MGTFSVTVEVGSADRRTFREVEALVDTGATFTWLPRGLLHELGHDSLRQQQFEFADGPIEDCDVGEVPIRIGTDVLTTICVFADSGQPSLGAVTLEQFLLAPDPIHKRLVPVVALAMKATTR